MTVFVSPAVVFPDNSLGRVDGGAPASGQVGERLSVPYSGLLGAGFTTLQWGNLNSLNLSAGEWDVTAEFLSVTGGTITNCQFCLSAFSGNSNTDHVTGDNESPLLGSLLATGMAIRYSFRSASNFTVFAKSALTIVIAANVCRAKISAIRSA